MMDHKNHHLHQKPSFSKDLEKERRLQDFEAQLYFYDVRLGVCGFIFTSDFTLNSHLKLKFRLEIPKPIKILRPLNPESLIYRTPTSV